MVRCSQKPMVCSVRRRKDLRVMFAGHKMRWKKGGWSMVTVWSVKPAESYGLGERCQTAWYDGHVEFHWSKKKFPNTLITSHHVFEIRLPSFFQIFRLTLVSLGSPSLRVQNLCWAFLATGNDNSTWRGSEWHDTEYDASILLTVVLISCPNIADSSRGTPGITRYSASHTSIRHESGVTVLFQLS